MINDVIKINNEKKRYISLDVLKVICVFFIFVYHFYMDIDFVHNMCDLIYVKDLIIRPNMHFALVGCALFLMISGATLKLTYDGNIINFYKKRLLRILVPFYIAYFIAFCFKCANLNSTHIFSPTISFSNIIYTIFGMDEYYMAGGVETFTLGVGEWFLGCIMFCYLVFPLLHYLDKRFSYILFIISTIYYLYINFHYDGLNLIMPQHFSFLCQVYNFYLGIYLMDEEFLERINSFIVLLMAIIVCFTYKSLTGYYIIDNFKTTLVTPCIFIIFIKLEDIFKRIKFNEVLSEFSGAISFEFFLIHHVVIYQTNILLRYMKLDYFYTSCIFIFDLFFTIFLAIIIHTIAKSIYIIFDLIKNRINLWIKYMPIEKSIDIKTK